MLFKVCNDTPFSSRALTARAFVDTPDKTLYARGGHDFNEALRECGHEPNYTQLKKAVHDIIWRSFHPTTLMFKMIVDSIPSLGY